MSDKREREPLLTRRNDSRGETTGFPNPIRRNAQRQEEGSDVVQLPTGQFTLWKTLLLLNVTLLILLSVVAGLYARRVADDGDNAPLPSPTSVPDDAVMSYSTLRPDSCRNPQSGNWLKTHEIPEGKSVANAFEELASRNREIVHRILLGGFKSHRWHALDNNLSDPQKAVDRQNFNKVKWLFDSCMDKATIDSVGTKPLLPLLREIQHLYPITATSEIVNKTTSDFIDNSRVYLAHTLAYLSKIGTNALFRFAVGEDPKDPEKTSLKITQSGLSMPSKEYYKQVDMLSLLHDTVAEILDLVLSKMPELHWNSGIARNAAQLIVELETRLASISDLPEFLKDPVRTYNPMTISQLIKLSPQVDWGQLLAHILPKTSPYQNTVIVSSPRYLRELSTHVLGNTTQNAIQAYLLWQTIIEYEPALGEEVQKPLERFKAKLYGINAKVTRPRWDICLDQVDDALGLLAGRYFVLETFDQTTKARADGFLKSIKDVFLNRLQELTWMDDLTRERAVEKVDMLVHKAGYPTKAPDVMSPISLSDYYSELVIDSNDYFGNYLRSHRWQVMKNWKRVGTLPDKSLWLMNPQVVDAYNNRPYNEVVFPAGIMQGPFFSGGYPEYLNYGGIGVVVGHELTHGFDNIGRHYDGKGLLNEWWTNKTLEVFEEKAKCFVDQYENFTMEGPNGHQIHLNGQRTLAENMADSGGVRQSYIAWKRRYDQNRNGTRNILLPGLENITPEQLFFINFGRVWCGKSTRSQTKQTILLDGHSPEKWRVIGALQNSPHFAAVFKCPVGTLMNPEKKCQLW